MLIIWITVSLVIAIAFWLAFWSVLNYFSGQSHWQEKFVADSLQPPPDGFYNGSAYLLGNRPVPWLGKSFEMANSKGFNIFTPQGASLLEIMTPLYKLFRKNADGNTDAYYFKTSTSGVLRISRSTRSNWITRRPKTLS